MDSFGIMLSLCVNWMIESDPSEKVIIHCSAGIGRTGTTVTLITAIINTWAQLNKGESDPKISIFSIVRRLREQRYGLVQMPDQYKFIFIFLIQYLIKEQIIK